MTAKFCPHCGAPRLGAGKFCGSCGRVIQDQQNCPTCGQALPVGVTPTSEPSTSGKIIASSSDVRVAQLDPAFISDSRLVYGADFAKGDCINCGSTEKSSDLECKVCGYQGL